MSYLFPLLFFLGLGIELMISCLSGNGAKDVAEVLLTLKNKEMADKLDWHVAQ